MADFTFNLIKSNDERLCLMGFEFWCRLGTEELNKLNLDKERKTQNCKYYFETFYSTLKEIIDKFIVLNSKEDLEDDWNTSKASCFILVILVKVCSSEKVDSISSEIKGKL